MTLAAGGSLDPRGPAAGSVADLWWFMLVLGAVVFVAVAVLLAWALFRRRVPEGTETHASTGKSINRWVIGGGVVMPVAVLAVVFGATLVTMRDLPPPPPPDALVVEVVGHQWWWEVHYPRAGITTANELHIPVGRPVVLQLTSADVIHSFWVPALAGKMDALPDGTNTLALEAAEPGEYRGECAEFCGLQHAHMGVVVVAESQEQFDSWVAGRQQGAAEPAGAAARRGQALFFEAGCASCHTVRGTDAAGTGGPDLTHVASRPFLGAGAVANTTAELAEWVRDPHTAKEGVKMPAADLGPEEIDALVAYLETLR